MNSFRDHSLSPQNKFRPGRFDVSARYSHPEKKDHWIKIYVSLDEIEQVESFHYELENFDVFTPYLSALSQLLPGLEIEEALALTTEDLALFFQGDLEFEEIWAEESVPAFMVPLFLLESALLDYRGQIPTYSELMKRPSESLICRCFGVYEEEIAELAQSRAGIGVGDVTATLLAGGGCTSCVEDIEDILRKNSAEEVATEKVATDQSCTTIDPQMHKRLHSLLKVWQKHAPALQSLGLQNFSVNHVKTEGGLFYLQFSQGLEAQIEQLLMESLRDYLQKNLPAEFTVVFLPPVR